MRSRIALVTLIGLLAAALCCLSTSTATAGVGLYGRSEMQSTPAEGIGEMPRQRTADLPTEGIGEMPRSSQGAVQTRGLEEIVKIVLTDLFRLTALVP